MRIKKLFLKMNKAIFWRENVTVPSWCALTNQQYQCWRFTGFLAASEGADSSPGCCTDTLLAAPNFFLKAEDSRGKKDQHHRQRSECNSSNYIDQLAVF